MASREAESPVRKESWKLAIASSGLPLLNKENYFVMYLQMLGFQVT